MPTDPMDDFWRHVIEGATPEQLRSMLRDAIANNKRLSAALTADDRLGWTALVFEALVDHAREGGSYRYLIYDRLGFDAGAYAVLYTAGGMTISNDFVITEADPADQQLAARLREYADRKEPPTSGGMADPISDDRKLLFDVMDRLTDLSAACEREQERRARLQAELDALRAEQQAQRDVAKP